MILARKGKATSVAPQGHSPARQGDSLAMIGRQHVIWVTPKVEAQGR